MSSQMALPSNSKSKRLTDHYSCSYLYESSAKQALHGLVLASCDPTSDTTSALVNLDDESMKAVTVEDHVISAHMSCNCCKIEFQDRDEQMSHYKSDWHRYNLHLRLRGLDSMSEENFEKVAGDISSISGSDEEAEDDDKRSDVIETFMDTPEFQSKISRSNERKFPKVYFKNTSGDLISVYRCLLHHKKNPITEPSELAAAASKLPHQCKWIVLMITSGHFAGAVFSGGQVVEHKTFHRYTVRAKRGTAQSHRDGQGNAPKSAGASLRRYNEIALSQEVQELLKSWNSHIDACDYIFVRIPVANKGTFFGGKNPGLQKDDSRIRVIPFATRRPTFKEVKRVHQMLASVECYGPDAAVDGFIPLSPPRVFVEDTGLLEVRNSDPQRTPSKKKGKSENSNVQSKPDTPVKVKECAPEQVASSESSDNDVELCEVSEKIDFLNLKEFDHTPKRKRKGKKKKNSPNSSTDAFNYQDDEDEKEMLLKNALFTVCKTGKTESVRKLLEEIRLSRTNEDSTSIGTEQLKDEGSSVAQTVQNPSEASVYSIATDLDDKVQYKNDMNSDNLKNSGEPNLVKDSDISTKQSIYQGQPDEAKCVSPVGKFLNQPLGKNSGTFLHLVCMEGYHELVTIFLEEGADPAIKDKSGKLPYNTGGPEVRNAFRRFMADFPDKFDYSAAQIPSALTTEMEMAKKQKLAERRKAKRKAAQERNQEKKAEEAKVRQENEEKNRFLALSDREKRALAAERRLLQQHVEQGVNKPVLSRCWQCGTDITGQTPFEYADFKFCTTRCLREHRSKAKTK